MEIRLSAFDVRTATEVSSGDEIIVGAQSRLPALLVGIIDAIFI